MKVMISSELMCIGVGCVCVCGCVGVCVCVAGKAINIKEKDLLHVM